MSTEDQDYKLLTTKVGKQQVKVRNYTTGADEEAIMELLMSANVTTVETTGARDEHGKEINKRVSTIDATVQVKYVRLLLERFVVEVDGKTEGVVPQVYEMRRDDFTLILEFVKKLTADIGGLDEAQKKS